MSITTRAILAITIITLLMTGCKKGDTGSAGPQGNIGATGADGTKIFSGQGAPATTLGRNGDFYIDLTTSNMYGPKADAGWGAPYSLRGTSGTNGTNGSAGSKIYSGTGTPAINTGIAGDYFMSTDTYLFYGPKTEAGWGTPVNLKGPKGDKGESGATATTVTISKDTWLWSAGTEFSRKFDIVELNIPQITQDIFDNGIVMVYGRLTSDVNTWNALPYSFSFDSHSTFVNYEIKPGKLVIKVSNSLNSTNIGIARFDMKAVMIPGSISATTAGNQNQININGQVYTQKQLQAMSYEQSARLFKFED